MANLDKAFRQNMQQKAPDELLRFQGHSGGLTGAGIVLPAESHSAIFQRDQTLVGDSYSMGIARQVLQDLSRSAERRLGINYPIGARRPVWPFDEPPLLSQGLELTVKAELALAESSF
jgi:hypothetical protein